MKILQSIEGSCGANRNAPAVARILRAGGEAFFLALLAAVVPFLVVIDVAVLEHGIREISVTELTQEALLAFAAGSFGYAAFRRPEARGFLVLAAGFLTCMLIRELDGIWDKIWHGFWFWPALLTAVASIGSTVRFWRDSVIGPMAGFVGTKAYVHLLIGLLTVLLFSRIFGSGNLLWKQLLGTAYSSVFRGALQEGIELFGYLFIAYGAFRMLRRRESTEFR